MRSAPQRRGPLDRQAFALSLTIAGFQGLAHSIEHESWDYTDCNYQTCDKLDFFAPAEGKIVDRLKAAGALLHGSEMAWALSDLHIVGMQRS